MKILIQACKPGSLIILPFLFLFSNSFSQNVSTTGYPVIYYDGNPTIPVDPGLTITSSGTISNARVRIIENFNTGDILNYSVSLPIGVTSSYNATFGELVFTGTATASQWQSLLRSVTFHTTSTVEDDRRVTFSLGNLVVGSNGHFYEYVAFGSVANVLTWTQSKDAAAARNYMGLTGYLATITSQTENDLIFQRLSASGWIGSTDDYLQINAATGATTYSDQTTAEGNWYWVTGPEAGTQFSHSPWAGATPVAINSMYLNWSGNEPNNNWNQVNSGVTGEQYGEIYSGASAWGTPGKWNDFYNLNSDMDFIQGYVVEYGGMPSDASVSLAASRTIVFDGILAVSGLQLNAVTMQETIRLNWSAITNSTTDSFVVLHSTDGIHFSAKTTLPATGSANNYSWVHQHPGSTMNYYRIQTIDKSGKVSYSKMVSIKLVSSTANWSCFPNPATYNDNIHLNIISEKTQPVRIILFTIAGQRQQDMPLTVHPGIQTYSFFINNRGTGMYMVGVMDHDGKYIGPIQKLVVK
jgi:hypothetical protein